MYFTKYNPNFTKIVKAGTYDCIEYREEWFSFNSTCFAETNGRNSRSYVFRIFSIRRVKPFKLIIAECRWNDTHIFWEPYKYFDACLNQTCNCDFRTLYTAIWDNRFYAMKTYIKDFLWCNHSERSSLYTKNFATVYLSIWLHCWFSVILVMQAAAMIKILLFVLPFCATLATIWCSAETNGK